jgi:hypothetical protein
MSSVFTDDEVVSCCIVFHKIVATANVRIIVSGKEKAASRGGAAFSEVSKSLIVLQAFR